MYAGIPQANKASWTAARADKHSLLNGNVNPQRGRIQKPSTRSGKVDLAAGSAGFIYRENCPLQNINAWLIKNNRSGRRGFVVSAISGTSL
jgi:hypothetical protein